VRLNVNHLDRITVLEMPRKVAISNACTVSSKRRKGVRSTPARAPSASPASIATSRNWRAPSPGVYTLRSVR
jgi:hypothetical protein